MSTAIVLHRTTLVFWNGAQVRNDFFDWLVSQIGAFESSVYFRDVSIVVF